MRRQLAQCVHWIDLGQEHLEALEAELLSDDLDGATQSFKSAWVAMMEPVRVLSRCWDGSFWEDWDQRDFVLDNIEEAQTLLLDAGPDDLRGILLALKELLHLNLMMLRNALTLLTADLGLTATIGHE
ncbi:MAG: hypothetical protein H6684_07875 [Deltaproteobacteria bacterium]|nr:hypothetical protein [Deltaproteobacteria bacterium]MCB9488632.1 hypothetical protein [Deltaproteobacteria bacterium]